MSIILAMPGKPQYQRAFWQQAIVDTGLEFYTQLAFQANGRWNDTYPSELIEANEDPSHIAVEQYNHTRVRLDDDYQPKKYAYTYLDYEPKKYIDGNRETWLEHKLNDGYDNADIEAIKQMRRGVSEATDGLPFSVYRTPVIGARKPIETHKLKSAHEITDMCEWVWMDAYPRLAPYTHDNLGQWHDKLVRDFGSLSKLGRRVIPWIWPSYRINETQAQIYGAATIKSLKMIPGVHSIGIWVDCNVEVSARRQTKNTIAMAEYLRDFMES